MWLTVESEISVRSATTPAEIALLRAVLAHRVLQIAQRAKMMEAQITSRILTISFVQQAAQLDTMETPQYLHASLATIIVQIAQPMQ